MFESLFNVAPNELLTAQVQFAWPISALLLAIVAAVSLAWLCSGYFSAARDVTLMALRASLAALVVLILAEPEFLLPRADSTAGAIAVLIDDSASMSIEDSAGGVSRAQAARMALVKEVGTLAHALEERFDVRYLHFDARLQTRTDGEQVAGRPALRGEAVLPSSAKVLTAVSDPLGAIREVVSAGDIAAVVLISDGGQVSGVDERDQLAQLSGSGVAVHTLGVGDRRLAPDVALQAVSVPPRVLNEDEVDVRVELSAIGFADQVLKLTVTNNGVLAGEGSVRIDADQFRSSVSVPIRVHEPGLRHIAVRAHAPSGDRVMANDTSSTVLNVRARAVKILHFEAEPRFEVKFLRRALADDNALSLSSLVRTGDNRYLRLGVSTQEELADGFPTTAEELFRYSVLVIGSVHAATFSEAQQQLLEDFVSVRGGSVLFMGGRNAFAEGDWGSNRASRMMPVFLDQANESFNVAVRAGVTPAGRLHAVTRGLFDGSATDQVLSLPELAVVNAVRRVKDGASVLLQGDDGNAFPLVMLAWHRYGAGRVAVLPVRDTWRWRMHADMPLEDRTHELFWRRLVRWLARDVPTRISVQVIPTLAAVGQSVRVLATIRDEQFKVVNNARGQVRITTPLGGIIERSLDGEPEPRGGAQRSGAQSRGDYAARFVARYTGLYEVYGGDAGEAEDDAVAVLVNDTAVGLVASASGEEFVAPALHDERLKRIASATRGSYRHLSDVGDLAARIAGSVPVMQSWHRVELWNAPALLVSVLLLACGEWWLRRRRRYLP
ncbi:MAG: putative membrane protein [Gammaproteobacteria bacterium]